MENWIFIIPIRTTNFRSRSIQKTVAEKRRINRNRQNLDRERMQLFSEERVYDSLLESGLFEQFSNSFFVIAEDKAGLAVDNSEKTAHHCGYVKYSNERSRKFCIRTQIETAENGAAACESLPLIRRQRDM